MRATPYFLIMAILIAGIVIAFQTFNEVTDESLAQVVRPTVTPRPWPTSPSRPPSPTFAPEPFQPLEPNQANVAPGIQPPAQAMPAQSGESSSIPGAPAPTQTLTAQPQGTTVPPPTAPTASATAEATLFVGNTGGEGVYLRATPRMDDLLRPWPENTPMVVISPRIEGDGHMWERVRAPDGSEGYIPAEYLVGHP